MLSDLCKIGFMVCSYGKSASSVEETLRCVGVFNSLEFKLLQHGRIIDIIKTAYLSATLIFSIKPGDFYYLRLLLQVHKTFSPSSTSLE